MARLKAAGLMLTLALGVFGAPHAAGGQGPAKVPRIGYLVLAPLALTPTAEREAFLQGLRELGYVEGQSIAIEYRSANWNPELLPDLAAELVDLKVDVIVAVPGAIDAARKATKTIPIVIPAAAEPVETGLVASFARPGGNITGTSASFPEMEGKRLQLLKEAVPKATRVAVLWNPSNDGALLAFRHLEAAARSLRVTLQSHEVKAPGDVQAALSAMAKRRPDALVTFVSPLTTAYRPIILEAATKHRVPTMFAARADVEAGALMSYAESLPELFRRAATYVDKILKGAKAGELPIEQPKKFEFVINIKTAMMLGLKIPQSLLLRADQLIQ